MKKWLLFVVLGLSLSSQPARADIAAIVAAQAAYVKAIQSVATNFAVYVSGITVRTSNFIGACEVNIAAAGRNLVAAVTPAQQGYTNYVGARNTDRANYLGAVWTNLVNWVNNTARYAPAYLAAVQAEAARQWTDQNNYINGWFNDRMNEINAWYAAVTKPYVDAYNGYVAQQRSYQQAARVEGDRQIAEGQKVYEATVKPYYDAIAALEAQKAFADCPFAARAPIVGCQKISVSAQGYDLYVVFNSTNSGQRGFRMFIPASLRFPAPVIMDLHGLGGNSNLQRGITNFVAYSVSLGFILLNLDGYGSSWNAGTCCGVSKDNKIDETQYVRDVLNITRTYFSVDNDRVHAAGLSNGAFEVHRLACELSDQIASVAGVVGNNGQFETLGGPLFYQCKLSRPVPVLMADAPNDPCVLFGGGKGICPVTNVSAFDDLKVWSKNNGCADASPALVGQAGNSQYYRLPTCSQAREVLLQVENGGGHAWFGNSTVNAIQWFAAHPRGALGSVAIVAGESDDSSDGDTAPVGRVATQPAHEEHEGRLQFEGEGPLDAPATSVTYHNRSHHAL